MFEVIEMGEGGWWGVFLVNPKKKNDRYLVTGTFNKKPDAEHFQREFTRILTEGVTNAAS